MAISMHPDEWQTFTQRLAETIAWCDLYANLDDPENCLRNFELLPDEFKNNLDEMWISPTLVDSIAQKRAALLKQMGKYPNEAELSLHGGRLLVYFPDIDTYDGASCPESRGFIGCYPPPETAPLWGTWIQVLQQARIGEHIERYLISWIPHALIKLADNAVSVEALECIIWIEHPEFNSDLKQQIAEGLIK
jgi:hypothetical protein